MSQVTIKEIAEKAGVSIATVSRAINGDYPVGKETKKRIDSAISELGYHPNAIARSLRNKRTNLLAFIVPDMANSFFMEIAKGIESVTFSKGYSLVVASSSGDSSREKKVINALMEKRLDGIFLASSDSEDGFLKNVCNAFDTSAILIDRPIPKSGFPKVVWNDRGDMERLTEYLIAKGHRKISIINVSLENLNGRSRYQGFKDAMEKAGIPIKDSWVSPSGFRREDSYHFAAKVMKSGDLPSAFLCANNIMLQGLIMATEDFGLKIGIDISVVCFGVPSFSYGKKITGMKLNTNEMGRFAGEMMLNELSEESFEQNVILNAELVEGDSVIDISE